FNADGKEKETHRDRWVQVAKCRDDVRNRGVRSGVNVSLMTEGRPEREPRFIGRGCFGSGVGLELAQEVRNLCGRAIGVPQLVPSGAFERNHAVIVAWGREDWRGCYIAILRRWSLRARRRRCG